MGLQTNLCALKSRRSIHAALLSVCGRLRAFDAPPVQALACYFLACCLLPLLSQGARNRRVCSLLPTNGQCELGGDFEHKLDPREQLSSNSRVRNTRLTLDQCLRPSQLTRAANTRWTTQTDTTATPRTVPLGGSRRRRCRGSALHAGLVPTDPGAGRRST